VGLVLDTAVIVAAMRSPSGASAEILRAARQGEITLVLSVALALEYEAICSEAEHRLASGLSMREVDVFITALIALTEPVETHFLWRPQLRDPGNEMVLEASVNGRADALVTFNLRDFGAAPSRFGVELLLPREAIGRIRK
jgi:putative PIN family toxin of toxin-antitoxin system